MPNSKNPGNDLVPEGVACGVIEHCPGFWRCAPMGLTKRSLPTLCVRIFHAYFSNVDVVFSSALLSVSDQSHRTSSPSSWERSDVGDRRFNAPAHQAGVAKAATRCPCVRREGPSNCLSTRLADTSAGRLLYRSIVLIPAGPSSRFLNFIRLNIFMLVMLDFGPAMYIRAIWLRPALIAKCFHQPP